MSTPQRHQHWGTAWDVPQSSTVYSTIPSVHPSVDPILIYHPDNEGLHEMSHTVPKSTPQFLVSIPFHCTTGHWGTASFQGLEVYPSVPSVHLIPLYHRSLWDCMGYPTESKVYSSVPSVHPISLYHTASDDPLSGIFYSSVRSVHPIPLYMYHHTHTTGLHGKFNTVTFKSA